MLSGIGSALTAHGKHEIALTVGSLHPGARRLEHAHRCSVGVTIAIARADTDQRDLGPHDRERFDRDRISTAVMPHLERVDVAEYALAHQRIQHDRLCISGKKCRVPRCRHKQDEARLVGARVWWRHRRRQHRQGDSTAREPLGREHFSDRCTQSGDLHR